MSKQSGPITLASDELLRKFEQVIQVQFEAEIVVEEIYRNYSNGLRNVCIVSCKARDSKYSGYYQLGLPGPIDRLLLCTNGETIIGIVTRYTGDGEQIGLIRPKLIEHSVEEEYDVRSDVHEHVLVRKKDRMV